MVALFERAIAGSILVALVLILAKIPPGQPAVQVPIKWYRLLADTMVNLTTAQLLREVNATTRVRCGTRCQGDKSCFGFEYTQMDATGQPPAGRIPGSCRLIRGNGAADVAAFVRGAAAGTDVFWLHGIKTRQPDKTFFPYSNNDMPERTYSWCTSIEATFEYPHSTCTITRPQDANSEKQIGKSGFHVQKKRLRRQFWLPYALGTKVT